MALTIVQMLVPASKYSIKCPYTMEPQYITIHNTACDATAKAEISYMITNNKQTSFHFAVDDTQAVQGLPLNRNGWHAGDGNGKGNRASIGIEISWSLGGGPKFEKAEDNAAYLTAALLKERGWGIDRVKKHQDWSGKYCPHRTLDMGWQRFLDMVQKYLGASTVNTSAAAPASSAQPATPSASTSTKYKVNDKVSYSKIYTSSSSDNALNPAIKSGTITKVIAGAKNPYLINGGTGWVRDSVITTPATSAPTQSSTPVPSTSTDSSYKVKITASALNVRAGAGINYKINTVVKKNEVYTIVEEKNGWGKLKSGAGWISLSYTKKI